MDELTATRKRLNFARVCVLIGANKKLPTKVPIHVGSVESFDVEYQWKPVSCIHCNRFGHDTWIFKAKRALSVSDPNPDSIPSGISVLIGSDSEPMPVDNTMPRQGNTAAHSPSELNPSSSNAGERFSSAVNCSEPGSVTAASFYSLATNILEAGCAALPDAQENADVPCGGLYCACAQWTIGFFQYYGTTIQTSNKFLVLGGIDEEKLEEPAD